jgi:hypothetical protein
VLYPKDQSVSIRRDHDRITFSWKRKPAEGIAFLCMAALLLVGFIGVSFEPMRNGHVRTLTELLPMWGLIGLMAAPLIYTGLAYLLNRTTIVADKDQISRTIQPIPWSLPLVLATSGLKQVFASTRSLRKSTSGETTGTLYLLDAEDHAHVLAAQLPSSFAANQIGHELQDFYGLQDLPIYGITIDADHPGPRPI